MIKPISKYKNGFYDLFTPLNDKNVDIERADIHIFCFIFATVKHGTASDHL